MGVKIIGNVPKANTPSHESDWLFSRIERFGTPQLTSNPPYWVTVSGKVYFSGSEKEKLEVGIQYSDDPIHGIIIEATKDPQDFVFHSYSEKFDRYHDAAHGYIDVECEPLADTGITIYISHLKVELGKEYYPIWTPAPEDLEYWLKQLEGKGAPAADPGMSETDGPE